MSRRPRPLGEVVSGLRAELAPATALAGVQQAWETVAGETVARHSQPVSERNGVVTVRCDSAVWAAELTMMSSTLLEHLAQRTPAGRGVRELRFVAGR